MTTKPLPSTLAFAWSEVDRLKEERDAAIRERDVLWRLLLRQSREHTHWLSSNTDR